MSGILEQIDVNRSVWVAGKPRHEPLPPLAGDTQADVVIIGGGFTGVSTAYHLARAHPHKRILLLEARELANGASGRNGGLMLNWIAGVHSPDPEHARRIYDVTQLGMRIIGDMIREHGLDVPHHREGSLEVITHERLVEEEAARVEAYAAAGIPLALLDRGALAGHVRLDGALAAVFDPNAGHLDGVAFLRGLRPVIRELGVEVHEGTPVVRIEEGKKVRILTPGGEVLADTVVLATGAYTPHLGYFRHAMFPLQSHVVATAPGDEATWAELGYPGRLGFSDDLDRIAYGSMTNRGELVFGGGSNAAYSYLFGGHTAHRRPPERGFRAVERRLSRYLPAARRLPIAHRWTGTLSITMSRVCAIGALGEHRNVLYALGFSGHGIVMANLAGRVLCDVYSGDDERWRWFPFFEPRLFPIPREPLRWLGYHAFTMLTGRSPRRAP